MLTAAVCLAGCAAGPDSAAGFRLPDGDAARGRQAFEELKCHQCHRVAGLEELPSPTADPPVPVVLGGRVPHVKTDGELVTSLIHPSHRIASGYRTQGVELEQGVSRMPSYREVMTVGQMIDLVAFLQSRYEVVRPGR